MKGYVGTKTPREIRDLWQTPKFVFDYYDKRFGFKVDLAASDDNHLCESYFTENDSAFLSDVGQFHGAIFCNPPYSETGKWVDLCISISVASQVPVVMLIPADTSVKWFKTALCACSECHLVSGRLSFINAQSGLPVSGNNKGPAVFVFDSMSPVRSYVSLIGRDEMKK